MYDKREYLVHNSVIMGDYVIIHAGAHIYENCTLGDNVVIGDNAILRKNTTIDHDSVFGTMSQTEGDVEIGHDTTIHTCVHITKGAKIGNGVFIAPYVCMLNTPRIVHGRKIPLELKPPIIRDYARIGAGAIISPGVKIGKNAQVGLGALVTKDVPEATLVYGVPAKIIRDVPKEELL